MKLTLPSYLAVCAQRLGLALTLGFCATNLYAKTSCPPAAVMPTPEQMRAGMQVAQDRGFLWRISKQGQTSYLYGTIHIGRLAWVFPGPQVLKAFKQTDTLALEIDPLDPTIIDQLRTEMAAVPRRALPAVLTKKLQAERKRACLAEDLAQTLTPEMLLTTLSASAARAQGLYPDYGIDVVYAGLAHQQQKKVVSLESPATQVQALHGHNMDETIAMVESGLAHLQGKQTAVMHLRIANMWNRHQLDELNSYPQWCQCLDTPSDRLLMTRMLDERNPAMADRIDALHSTGQTVFAAVGAMHMAGPMGLPKLMAQRGYQVEWVEFAPPLPDRP